MALVVEDKMVIPQMAKWMYNNVLGLKIHSVGKFEVVIDMVEVGEANQFHEAFLLDNFILFE